MSGLDLPPPPSFLTPPTLLALLLPSPLPPLPPPPLRPSPPPHNPPPARLIILLGATGFSHLPPPPPPPPPPSPGWMVPGRWLQPPRRSCFAEPSTQTSSLITPLPPAPFSPRSPRLTRPRPALIRASFPARPPPLPAGCCDTISLRTRPSLLTPSPRAFWPLSYPSRLSPPPPPYLSRAGRRDRREALLPLSRYATTRRGLTSRATQRRAKAADADQHQYPAGGFGCGEMRPIICDWAPEVEINPIA